MDYYTSVIEILLEEADGHLPQLSGPSGIFDFVSTDSLLVI